jgi:long-chain acyl-CoA synthetase
MSSNPWLSHYDPGVEADLEYRHVPLFTFLDEVGHSAPNLVCTIFQDNKITYGEMRSATEAFAAGLHQRGIRKGDRVGLILPNSPQFVLAFYGIIKAGGIVVAMNPQYKQRELAFQLDNAGIKLVIALDSYRSIVEEVCQWTGIEEVVYTALEDAFSITAALQTSYGGQSEFLKLISEFAGQMRPEVNIRTEDPVIFQYSGGTTGIPKGAIGLHRNLVANTMQFRSWLVGLEQNREVVLCAIPLFHVYGMVIAMSMGVALGASLILIQNPRDIQDVLSNIDRYQSNPFPRCSKYVS